MGKKVFAISELEKLSAEEVIDKIQYENYSLLKTLGAEKMRREMVPVGKICNTAINYFLGTTGPKSDEAEHSQNARRKLVRVLSKLTPGGYDGFPADTKTGMVVGFNHPSLGEIARILMMKIDKMGDKPMLFPVNLPWYESLATDYDKICRLGIIITPTITPATWTKMNLRKGTPEHVEGARMKQEFRDLYTTKSAEVMHEGGVIFVAPSATRQAKVFASEEVYKKEAPVIPTMSVLAEKLFADSKVSCDFLPMAVLPPKDYKRGLNFYKKYELIPGKKFTAKEIREKYLDKGREKDFDYDFHLRIAEKLPREFWY